MEGKDLKSEITEAAISMQTILDEEVSALLTTTQLIKRGVLPEGKYTANGGKVELKITKFREAKGD